jgi:hypothetical protein
MRPELAMRTMLIRASLLGAILLLLSPLSSFAIFPISNEPKEQPINFSHKLHVTQNGISCQYCHLYARRSFSSGVPPVSTCVGCHGPHGAELVQPDSAEVDIMRDHWAEGTPIPWVKLHDIPDFVRFPHKKHINADASRFIDGAGNDCDMNADPRSLACRVMHFRNGGDERCQSCHGNVPQMEVAYVVDENFGGMGWCMQCHLQVEGAIERKRAMSTLDGWFNAKENEAKREAQAYLINEKGYHNPNLLDCYTCHY